MSILGLHRRPVHRVLAPNLPNPLQKGPPPGLTPDLCLLDLVPPIHPVWDDVKPVIHYWHDLKVDAHPLV